MAVVSPDAGPDASPDSGVVWTSWREDGVAALSAEDTRALERAFSDIHDEHRWGWGGSRSWMIEHPELSRPHLITMLTSRGGTLIARPRAIEVLGEIGNPDDVELLASLLDDPRESEWESALALAKIKTAAAFDALVAATASPHVDAAHAAIHALAYRGDEAARPVLESLLDHAHSGLRYAAVLALTRLGPGPSKAALKKRQRVEKDRDVKAALRKALR